MSIHERMTKRPYRIRLGVTVLVWVALLAAMLWLSFGLDVATLATDESVRAICGGSPPFGALNALAVIGACATVAVLVTAASFARGASGRPLIASLTTGVGAFLMWTALDGFEIADCAISV